MARVRLEHVTKRFGAIEAVHDVSLDIADEEFVVLLGPSGCGKTTMLRMIAGLEDVGEGRILIDDEDMSRVAPRDRDIAMVFQDYALYPHMTVYENMAFGLKLRHVPKKEIEMRIHLAAEMLGLMELLQRRPRTLSGGQRQRVALGRAVVRKPKVFLMDEPLSNLDAKLRTQMRAEIKNLYQRLHATVIYVTHDQTEAMTMGSRICVMNAGQIQQADTPEQIYHSPRNTFVAGFVGDPSMNMLQGTVRRLRNGALTCVVDGHEVPVPHSDQGLLQGRVDQPIILGVRPEDIHAVGTPTQGVSMHVTVRSVELLGRENMLYAAYGDQGLVVRGTHQWRPAPADTVAVAFDPERMHWFDPDTGKALTDLHACLSGSVERWPT